MKFLKCLETKLNAMETRLNKLDSLEEKVLSFDKDMKLLSVRVHDQNKALDHTLSKIDERIERVEFISAEYQSRIDVLEKENTNLKDKVTYLESQSMRNNLVLGGLKEEPGENLDLKFRELSL
jgi:chromosome segregation ATPase